MKIKYLKELKTKKEDNFLIKDQKFIFNKGDDLFKNTRNYGDKLGDRIIKKQEQIDFGRLPSDSTIDDMSDFLNMWGALTLSILCTFIAFLFYIPLLIIWLPSELVKFFFIKTSFYEYLIYLPANIMYYLLIKQMFVLIYTMGFHNIKEADVIEFKSKSSQFAEYTVWYQFYKK